ncbi:Ltp family lipoprotein [Actinoplanes sp. KI2]|uniref:Ltp family lipoprotein n=1 Tax=Actinoplanes sp. KI2 TaxID=2983315 RepID=UPI0021D5D7A0|nr:Ltp family lipoprotein [Actinoplanes sp. KI2]MCU7730924.1 Ltp family lipoprotein [Actinoplanes sp. KI2]
MSQQPFPPPLTSQPAKHPLLRWSLGIGIIAFLFARVPAVGPLLGLAAIIVSAAALTTMVNKTRPGWGLGLGVVALMISISSADATPATTVAATAPKVAATPPTIDATTEPTSRTTADPTTKPPIVEPTTKAAPPAVKPTTRAPTVEEQNAIRSAQSYIEFSAFSRKGLIEQLSSDGGDGYSVKAATYAVDSLHINFNEQAYKSAMSYLSISGFSRKGLIEQLSSDGGEGFTHSQAVYGVTKAGL